MPSKNVAVQFGNGQNIYFSGVRRQKGSGLGGIFGAIGRYLIPIARDYIIPHVIPAVRQILQDKAEKKQDLKSSLKQHGIKALKDIGHKVFSQKGSGRRRRKKTAKRPTKKHFRRKKIPKQRNKKTLTKKRITRKVKKRSRLKKIKDFRYIF